MAISKENRRNRIMEYALKMFTTLGIQQVTMDDIARGVGMGKGTLYRYFPSKEDLLYNTVDFYASHMEEAIKEVLEDEKKTAEQKLSLFLKTVAENLSHINPALLDYLERSTPMVYEKIVQTRQRIIMTNLVKLFEDGKMSGLYVMDVDATLVAHIILGAVNHLVNTKTLYSMDYTFDRLFNSITTLILKGCLTEKGRELLN